MPAPTHLTLLAITLAACAAAPRPAPDSPGSTRGLVRASSALGVNLRVNARVAGQLRPLAPGDELHSGDQIELFVEVDQPAFVYVLQFFADGSAQVLFPDAGQRRVAPGERVRVPEGSAWLQLDQHAGDENVYVVASARPLAQADRAVAGDIDVVRASAGAAGAATATDDRDPGGAPHVTTADRKRPRPTSAKLALLDMNTRAPTGATRGLVKVTDAATSPALVAESDDAGVAVFRFSFRHLP